MRIENKRILLTIGIICFLVTISFATYAYFSIQLNNRGIKSNKITGSTERIAKPTLVTNIETLKINLDSKHMDQTKAGTVYYATINGTPVTNATHGNGKYTLATASVPTGEVVFNCGYKYQITGTSSKTINDGSDENVKITFKNTGGEEVTYTLKQVLSGVEYTGMFPKLKTGENQTIEVMAYVENTNKIQDDLAGNTFSFRIQLSQGASGFSCNETESEFNLVKDSKGQPVAKFMVTKRKEIANLWSSGLEGDGLRYVGSGSYTSSTTPNNFICFGTKSTEECKSNEDKYMYRIIGVFPDENGEQHLKLRKISQIGDNVWGNMFEEQTWEDSILYNDLNGSEFLKNSTFDYLQDSLWLNKIENWKWTAVNTKTFSDSGLDYNLLTPIDIYLHEMNRVNKMSSIGSWTYPTGKIGVIYASDYLLSLGEESLNITGDTIENAAKLKTGWMHYENNIYSENIYYEWTMATLGVSYERSASYFITDTGEMYYLFPYHISILAGVVPVFYLTSDISFTSGSGTYDAPYIIE